MRSIIAALICLLAPVANAEPAIRIVDFTASWCPNCKILDPRLAEAVDRFDSADVEIVTLDLTQTARRYTPQQRANAQAEAIATAQAVKAGYVWDWYGPTTGLAVVIAADTGEPITCFTPRQSTEQIAGEIRLARLMAIHAPPGQRQQGELACPDRR